MADMSSLLKPSTMTAPHDLDHAGEGIRANILFGLAVSVALVGGIGAWAAMTSLAGAVIASGTVVVESSAKKVQHQTGGIVGAILVKEGDRVSAGDVIVRLDETMTRANLEIIASNMTARSRGRRGSRPNGWARPRSGFPPSLQAAPRSPTWRR
jgi:HlyD family secretion protein